MLGEAGQNVGEPGLRIDVIHLGRDDQAIHDRSSLATAIGAAEQPRLPAQGDGSAPTLDWLVNDKKIAPHIPVIDMAKREGGIFSREDFTYDKTRDVYICPAGKLLTTTGRIRDDDLRPYSASKRDCDICPLKMQCCPKDISRKLPASSVHR